ncbi:MAG: hypothetical protein PHS45_04365 [Bacilli bacterium]|nr:hypothetical protein [Bacilli bacterium]
MSDYILRKQDYEFLRELVKITSSIDKLYKKLYELDLKNQKDSDEYIKTLDYLSIAIDTEKWQYNKIDLTHNKCTALVEHILRDRLPDDFLSNSKSITMQHDNDRVMSRILVNLINRVGFDYQGIKNSLPSGFLNLFKIFDMPEFELLIIESAYKDLELKKALEEDLFNMFLLFIDEYLNNSKYSSFKSTLLKNKYNILFINSNIEANMLGESFNICNLINLRSEGMADHLEIDKNLFYFLKNLFGIEVVNYQIDELLEISDIDYADENKAVTSILRQGLMRSAFMFMSAETINDVNYDFHEYVDNPNYKGDTSISESVIIEAFRKIKRDRAKHKIISLKK